MDYVISYEGTWTFIRFASKPNSAVRTALKANGFKWSKRRGEWYVTTHIAEETIAHWVDLVLDKS